MSALADMPLTLTVEEAARILRCGRSATYAAVKSGEIPSIRVGRSIRVPRHQLFALLGIENDDDPVGETGSRSRTHAGDGGDENFT